ncbi:hypothetical protein HW932_20655 [Allochromatium humboldtianum]|uniref:Uncharacterized protein n=1 Tax=Allochromatium humboldtianum TaxID=504901 RepID=A0A850RLA7_9GAMM|nr:hypothetical protein [Allochromatium humboldtianum]NVZ11660.1 hypothetical protein [Allochromatium humboldtianum]
MSNNTHDTHDTHVSVDAERRLYIIKHQAGFSCLGFDNLEEHLAVLQERLGFSVESDAPVGTPERYAQYEQMLEEAGRHPKKMAATWFKPKTPLKVRRILEKAWREDITLRLFYGDSDTGRDWLEENDTFGRIGRSGGLMKVPLLLSDSGRFGAPILDDCIVKIQDEEGRVLWQHPKYHLPEMEIQKGPKNLWELRVEGDVRARFASFGEAAAYAAFLSGERYPD